MFYAGKTLLLRVRECSDSSLLRVVVSFPHFFAIVDCLYEFSSISGSPYGSRWISFGQVEASDLDVVCEPDAAKDAR